MLSITSLQDVPAALEARYPAGAGKHRMTLERMRALMEFLGNPQDAYRVVHVAGTSGKTSTAYYAAALLKGTGRKVGLAVSPHVEAINERVQINMQPLPEGAFLDELHTYLDLIGQSGLELTYFEVLYGFVLWEFKRQHVDYAVVEVGIGGLLDNTNVVTRPGKVCIITDIGMDHMSILGSRLGEIAAQKAGIIQLHNPVFCWRQPPAVMEAITAAARQQQADLHVLETPELGPDFSFLPLFQQRNFELALNAVRFARARDGLKALSSTAVTLAARTRIPARMEVFEYGGKMVIVDGSHNPQKLEALAASIRARYPDAPVAALVAFTRSKTPEGRIEPGIRVLTGIARHIICTSFTVPRHTPHRSYDPAQVAALCEKAARGTAEVVPDPQAAFKTLLKRPEKILLVTGSFFLLNEIRPVLVHGRQ